MVLNKNRRQKRGNSTAKLIIIFTILIGLFFGAQFVLSKKNPKTPPQGQTLSASVSLAMATSSVGTASWSNLQDRDGVFQLSYPRRFFKRNDKQVIAPLLNQPKEKAIVISHSIPVKFCSADFVCRASTTDMSITLFSVEKSFNDVYGELKKIYGTGMDVVTVDGHQGLRFEQGMEGGGIVYVVLPINDAKTLFISRSYLSEKILTKYQTAKDFIKVADQIALFDQILSTFSFRPGIQ